MMKEIGWRVWVDGGLIFDSREHTWEDVPGDGIIEMYVYKEGDYRESLCGHTYYYIAPHLEGFIYDSDNDPPDKIKKRYPGAIVKRGKRVPSEVMFRIQKEAAEYKWQLPVT